MRMKISLIVLWIIMMCFIIKLLKVFIFYNEMCGLGELIWLDVVSPAKTLVHWKLLYGRLAIDLKYKKVWFYDLCVFCVRIVLNISFICSSIVLLLCICENGWKDFSRMKSPFHGCSGMKSLLRLSKSFKG